MTLPTFISIIGLLAALVGFGLSLFCKIKLHIFKRGVVFLASSFYMGYALDLLYKTITGQNLDILLTTVFLSPVVLAILFMMIPNQIYDQIVREPIQKVRFIGDIKVEAASTDEDPVININGIGATDELSVMHSTSVSLTEEQARNLWGELGSILRKVKDIR